MVAFFLGANKFHGTIHSSYSKLKKLQFLDIEFNPVLFEFRCECVMLSRVCSC